MKLTPYARECLSRLASGPKTLDEIRDGHPNRLPSYIDKGWVTPLALGDHRNFLTYKTLYELTPAGRAALGGQHD